MNFEPDWKSKILVRLLGKQNSMTVLDAIELMYRQDFRERQNNFKVISRKATTSLIVINSFIIGSSLFLSSTVFKTLPILSFRKMLIDVLFVFGSYYVGLYSLCYWMKQDVRNSKILYLKNYDSDFMIHFNILASKYGIQQEKQVQGILNKQEFEEWLQGYLVRERGTMAEVL